MICKLFSWALWWYGRKEGPDSKSNRQTPAAPLPHAPGHRHYMLVMGHSSEGREVGIYPCYVTDFVVFLMRHCSLKCTIKIYPEDLPSHTALVKLSTFKDGIKRKEITVAYS